MNHTLLVLLRNADCPRTENMKLSTAESKFIDKESVLLGTTNLHFQILHSFFRTIDMTNAMRSPLMFTLGQGDVQLTVGHLD